MLGDGGKARDGMGYRGWQEALGGQEYVYSLLCGDDFTVVHTCQNFKLYLLLYKIAQNFKIVHLNMGSWLHVNYISNYVCACKGKLKAVF